MSFFQILILALICFFCFVTPKNDFGNNTTVF